MIRPISKVLLALAVLALASGSIETASAQSSPSKRTAFQSSGLKVSIASIATTATGVNIQMFVENISKNRQYLLLPRDVGASLNTGEKLRLTRVDGINSRYPGAAGQLAKNPVYTELPEMSYIEPGTSIAFSLEYTLDGGRREGGIDATGTISFTFIAVARTSSVAGELSPEAADKVGPPHVVNISFPFIPLQSN